MIEIVDLNAPEATSAWCLGLNSASSGAPVIGFRPSGSEFRSDGSDARPAGAPGTRHA